MLGKSDTGLCGSSDCTWSGGLFRHRKPAPTALIPTWFGLALGIGGFLAISPRESRRKLFMHINVTIALWASSALRLRPFADTFTRRRRASPANEIALASKLTMAGLLLIYVILCVRSFIAARRSGKV